MQLRRRHAGAGLIEFLVAVLILSFGLLAVGGMTAYGVQLPRISGNRAVATSIANDLIERMRANTGAFNGTAYSTALSYNGASTVPTAAAGMCTYPNCTPALLATMDLAVIQRQLRQQLPAGGFIVDLSAPYEGRVFILWQDPPSASALDSSSNDICPTGMPQFVLDSKPRCLTFRFKL